MDHCFENLRNVLTIKPKLFERSKNQAMNSIEYFISMKIFRQITEALNYLHSLKPEPLIHGNLKPENILIGMSCNKRICKLADFGLSKFIEDYFEYHPTIGVMKRYRAAEIGSDNRYDTKFDVLRLGMIGIELFSFDPNKLRLML